MAKNTLKSSAVRALSRTACLALVCQACAAGSAPEDGLAATGQALVQPGTDRVSSLPAPVAFHTAVVGAESADYAAEWQRLKDLNYHPVSLSGVRMPGGDIRYSSVFHKDSNVDGFFSYRGYTLDEYTAKFEELRDKGYRMIDVSAHQTGSGQRYEMAWVHEKDGSPWRNWRDATLAGLQDKLAEYRADGFRPIRLHGYQTDNGTRYSGVWVKDALGTNYRVILDKNGTDYGTEFADAIADGFRPIDISAYFVGSELRFTGVFVKDASISRYASFRGLTEAELDAKRQEYSEQNYVMVDVEHYSSSASSDVPRYAAVWVQRQNMNVVADFSLTNQAGWSADAVNALADLKTRLANFNGNVGFVVEDMSNGHYLGHRINEPFYMASTAKVMIAATVLDQVDAGVLTLGQTINYAASDILEQDDSPKVPSDATHTYTLRQSLAWMLNQSSTNATDRLVRLVGAPAINQYIEDAGITDVGELTAICELDRRIYEYQDPCVRTALTCRELERWSRTPYTDPSTPAGMACVANLTRNRDASYESYYATLANSVTPLQEAKLWRRIIEADILSGTQRDALVDIMDGTGNGYMTGMEGVFFDLQAGKFGDKREVKSWVGIGHNRGAAAGTADDVPQYSISIFTEDWPDYSDASKATAQTLMQALAEDALTILQDRR